MPADSVALMILERSDGLSHELLHQRVASSLPQLARFRSRLVDKPLGLGQPIWTEIDDYDPTGQIRSTVVRAPGRGRELAELIVQLTLGPPDRRKPLWEAWSIEGLLGGRWAVAVRMSPALSEGGASIWPRLLDTQSRAKPGTVLPTEPSLGTTPSLAGFVTGIMAELFETQVACGWLVADTVAGALEALRHRLRGAATSDAMSPAVPSMSGPVPHNAFNAPLTQRRAVAFASIPLAQLKTVNKAFGGSIANVFLAACTLSLRGWLQRHDTMPDRPLLMQTPLESPAGPTTIGNTFTVGRIRMPVQLDDPVQVLTDLHTATERLSKQRSVEKVLPATDFARLASLVPPTIARKAMRLGAGLGLVKRYETMCHGSVSYLSGTPARAYCAGAEVVAMHTVAPLTDGGLNITLTSHDDSVDVAVNACPDNVPAIDEIATGIAESVGTLVASARKSPRGRGRSVVTEISSHTKGSRVRHLW